MADRELEILQGALRGHVNALAVDIGSEALLVGAKVEREQGDDAGPPA